MSRGEGGSPYDCSGREPEFLLNFHLKGGKSDDTCKTLLHLFEIFTIFPSSEGFISCSWCSAFSIWGSLRKSFILLRLTHFQAFYIPLVWGSGAEQILQGRTLSSAGVSCLGHPICEMTLEWTEVISLLLHTRRQNRDFQFFLPAVILSVQTVSRNLLLSDFICFPLVPTLPSLALHTCWFYTDFFHRLQNFLSNILLPSEAGFFPGCRRRSRVIEITGRHWAIMEFAITRLIRFQGIASESPNLHGLPATGPLSYTGSTQAFRVSHANVVGTGWCSISGDVLAFHMVYFSASSFWQGRSANSVCHKCRRICRRACCWRLIIRYLGGRIRQDGENSN